MNSPFATARQHHAAQRELRGLDAGSAARAAREATARRQAAAAAAMREVRLRSESGGVAPVEAKGRNARARVKSVKAKSKAKAAARPVSKAPVRTGAQIAACVLMFVFVFIVGYGFSVLTGNTMMEHARRNKVEAMQKAQMARQDAVRLRNRLERITGLDSVESWARARGFQAPYGLPAEVRNAVATNR